MVCLIHACAQAERELEDSRKQFKSWSTNSSDWKDADTNNNRGSAVELPFNDDDDDEYDFVSSHSPVSTSEYEAEEEDMRRQQNSDKTFRSYPSSAVKSKSDAKQYDNITPGISILNSNGTISATNTPSKPIVQLIDSIKLSEYQQEESASAYYVEEASDEEEL